MRSYIFIFIFVLFFAPLSVFAETDSTESATFISTPTPVQIDYYMAYPGILPDNPLYVFKTTRDMLVGMLISDSYKRADFYVLNSDKRLGAAITMFEKKRFDLGIVALSKSNNYMHQGISQLPRVKAERKDVLGLRERMRTSIEKHQELLKNQESRVDKKYLQEFKNELTRLEEMHGLVLPSPKNR